MRDRTKQRNFDFTKYPEALEIIDSLPSHGRVRYVAEAIEEKDQREKGRVFTPEQIEYLNKYYIREDDING